jgi:hypothetical protein
MGILDIVKKYAGKYLPKVGAYLGDFLGKQLKEKGFDFVGDALKSISKSKNVDELKERGRHIITEGAGHAKDKAMEKLNPFLRSIEQRVHDRV